MKSSSKPLWHSPAVWLVVAAAAAFVGFMLFSDAGKDFIRGVNDWAQDLIGAHPVVGAVVFFLLSAASAILAFASSVVLVPAANEVWGKPVTFGLLWTGWMAGALITYAIGHFARSLLHRMVSRENLERYQAYVSKRMKLWTATVLCLAVPSELPGYLLGALSYPLPRFMVAIGIAEAVYAVGVIIAGESVAEAKPVFFVVTGAALVVIAVAAGYLLRRQRKKS